MSNDARVPAVIVYFTGDRRTGCRREFRIVCYAPERWHVPSSRGGVRVETEVQPLVYHWGDIDAEDAAYARDFVVEERGPDGLGVVRWAPCGEVPVGLVLAAALGRLVAGGALGDAGERHTVGDVSGIGTKTVCIDLGAIVG